MSSALSFLTPLKHAFRLGRSPGNLLLSFVGVVVLILGLKAIAYLPFGPDTVPADPNVEELDFFTGDALERATAANFERDTRTVADWPWLSRPALDPTVDKPLILVNSGGFFGWIPRLAGTFGLLVLSPFFTLLEPLFANDLSFEGRPLSAFAFRTTCLLWIVLVWAIFGGAVTRRAALQFTREEHPSLTSVLKFSTARIWWYVLAPLLGVLGIAFFLLVIYVGGLVGTIPFVGPVLLGLAYGVALLFGLLSALLVVGLLLGWPLMVPAISVQSIDAFDGFSRALSYVFGRPFRYLVCAACALLLGIVSLFVVDLLLGLTLILTESAVSTATGADYVLESARPLVTIVPLDQIVTADPSSDQLVHLVQYWLRGAALLVMAFLYSYFWSASTLIYLILRQVDDATDLEEIYVDDGSVGQHVVPVLHDAPGEESSDEQRDIPVAGVAGSEQEVIERPPGSIPEGAPEPPDEDAPPETGETQG